MHQKEKRIRIHQHYVFFKQKKPHDTHINFLNSAIPCNEIIACFVPGQRTGLLQKQFISVYQSPPLLRPFTDVHGRETVHGINISCSKKILDEGCKTFLAIGGITEGI